MTVYQAGEIILVSFPYSTGTRFAIRPALVILDTGDGDVVAARITTKLHATPHDVPITDWKGAGLLAPSVVRIHKLAVLEKTLVHRQLGHLQAQDRLQVSVVMKNTYGNW